jgi:hypothetical protein
MSVGVAEQIEEHRIEPELLRSAPRHLRVTYWSSLVFGVGLATFLFVGISVVCIAVESARMLWLAEQGRTTTATVTSCTFLDDSTGACSLHPAQIRSVNYLFDLNGMPHSGSITYNAASSATNTDTDQASTMPHDVELIRYGILNGRFIYSPASSLSVKSAGFAMIGAVLVGAACALIGARSLLGHRFVRRLARYGTPVIGTIKEKTITDDDGPRYYVIVGFLGVSGEGRQFKERCTPYQWRRLEIGQPITVLTIKTNKTWSAIYAHMPLRCA